MGAEIKFTHHSVSLADRYVYLRPKNYSDLPKGYHLIAAAHTDEHGWKVHQMDGQADPVKELDSSIWIHFPLLKAAAIVSDKDCQDFIELYNDEVRSRRKPDHFCGEYEDPRGDEYGFMQIAATGKGWVVRHHKERWEVHVPSLDFLERFISNCVGKKTSGALELFHAQFENDAITVEKRDAAGGVRFYIMRDRTEPLYADDRMDGQFDAMLGCTLRDRFQKPF